jgi:hypothetical protein
MENVTAKRDITTVIMTELVDKWVLAADDGVDLAADDGVDERLRLERGQVVRALA